MHEVARTADGEAERGESEDSDLLVVHFDLGTVTKMRRSSHSSHSFHSFHSFLVSSMPVLALSLLEEAAGRGSVMYGSLPLARVSTLSMYSWSEI